MYSADYFFFTRIFCCIFLLYFFPISPPLTHHTKDRSTAAKKYTERGCTKKEECSTPPHIDISLLLTHTHTHTRKHIDQKGDTHSRDTRLPVRPYGHLRWPPTEGRIGRYMICPHTRGTRGFPMVSCVVAKHADETATIRTHTQNHVVLFFWQLCLIQHTQIQIPPPTHTHTQ